MSESTRAESTGLLRNKLLIPRGPERAIVRTALLERLAACRTVRLTTLTAPAGYGKTTLAAALARQLTGCYVCWLSLDGGEDDVLRLLGAVTEALAAVLPDGGRAAQQWVEHGRAADVPAALFTQTAAAGQEIVLFLDDVQQLTRPEVGQVLAELVGRSSANLHWVLLSRHQLPFSTVRLLLEDDLLSLGAADLRLSQEETAEVLAVVGGLQVDSLRGFERIGSQLGVRGSDQTYNQVPTPCQTPHALALPLPSLFGHLGRLGLLGFATGQKKV
jgi:ATP/maltotriose-dependent transcriptional regulator MalT